MQGCDAVEISLIFQCAYATLSCLKVYFCEAWKEAVITELSENRTERLKAFGTGVLSEKHFVSYKTIKSTDVLGNTAELKKSLKMPKEDNQLTRWPPPCWFIHQVGLSSRMKT